MDFRIEYQVGLRGVGRIPRPTVRAEISKQIVPTVWHVPGFGVCYCSLRRKAVVTTRVSAPSCMSKIFCIGLNKTGTNSLHEALTMLGFTSLHWGGHECSKMITQALCKGLPLLHYVGDYDAYSDITPITMNFELADRQYPGSKFILTLRDLDPWLDSRVRHVQRNIAAQTRGDYSGTWLKVEPEVWKAQYLLHHKKVSEYFQNRPKDLLAMNICSGQGYEMLCPFLSRPAISAHFPWKNRTRG